MNMSKRLISIAAAKVPRPLRIIFNPPPVSNAADAKIYSTIVAALIAEIRPRSFREWLLLKDIADFDWAIRQLRLFKTAIVESYEPKTSLAPLLALPPVPPGTRDPMWDMLDRVLPPRGTPIERQTEL